MDTHITVAIDGPSGAGKSTIARAAARRFGLSYVDTGASKDLTADIKTAVQSLLAGGATSIVAAEAFSVDDPANETATVQVCSELGVPGTATNDISKLYGLKIRTRTAVVNASIMPKMLEAAKMKDWDGVVRYEGACAVLIEQLRFKSQEHELLPEHRREKTRIMQRILRNDAQIRCLAEPWLAQFEHLFEGQPQMMH